jgi:hypothetical protein
VAVALFTPWCFVKLLQINWEARENLEAVLPSVVQWVRENRGIYNIKKQDNEKIKACVLFKNKNKNINKQNKPKINICLYRL